MNPTEQHPIVAKLPLLNADGLDLLERLLEQLARHQWYGTDPDALPPLPEPLLEMVAEGGAR